MNQVQSTALAAGSSCKALIEKAVHDAIEQGASQRDLLLALRSVHVKLMEEFCEQDGITPDHFYNTMYRFIMAVELELIDKGRLPMRDDEGFITH